jgi:hypothetical protein
VNDKDFEKRLIGKMGSGIRFNGPGFHAVAF